MKTRNELAIAVPTEEAQRLADRLALAIQDGYDDRGVLDAVRAQVLRAIERAGAAAWCRECGEPLAEVPLVGRCPRCGGGHLRFASRP